MAKRPDLSDLSHDLRAAARFTNDDQEVMWPVGEAGRVVNELADHGLVVLGLDLRSDGGDSAPPGVATEVPWSAFRPGLAATLSEVEEARQQALEALQRPDLANLSEYGWVLITW